MRYLILLVLLVAACQPATNLSSNLPTQTAVPARSTLAPERIGLGKTVYAQQCASCHGVNLEGQPDWKAKNEDGSFRAPPHDASGHTWHHGDPTLLEAIRLGGARLEGMNIGGTSNMPAFRETLSEEEITAVLSYMKSTWPDDIRTLQWEVTVREEAQVKQ